MGPHPIQLSLYEEVGIQMAQREGHEKTQGDDIYSSHEVGTREVPNRTLPQASALSIPPLYSHSLRGPVMGSPGVAVAELSRPSALPGA